MERVYQIVALRSLGIPLSQIPAALACAPQLTQTLADQLTHVEAWLGELESLRSRLRHVLDQVADHPITLEELTDMIRKTVISQEILNEYLTGDERRQLAERAEHLGQAGRQQVEHDYPRLYRAAQEQFTAGAAPDSPAMQSIAAELETMSQQWAGPRAEVSDRVPTLRAERSEEISGRDYSELARYVATARAQYRAHVGHDHPTD